MFNSPFGKEEKNPIPDETKVIICCDLFVEDYVGGAELTTEAFVETCPVPYHKLHTSKVTVELLEEHYDKYWIFGNFSQLNPQLWPSIIANLKYSVLEYDYKFCRYRSPEKHEFLENEKCDCASDIHGKMISAFCYGAQSLYWMSEKQEE